MRASPLPRRLPLLLTLSVGLVLSLTIFYVARSNEQDRLQHDFEQRARSIANILVVGVNDNLEVLEFINNFYAASQSVTRAEFRTFTRAGLPDYATLYALWWVPQLADAERAAFETSVQREGFLNFQIMDLALTGERRPAPSREEYFPVYFVEPMDESQAAGVDLANLPFMLDAMQLARTNSGLVATERFQWPGTADTRQLLGVLVPVRRASTLQGFVVGLFHLEDIVANTLHNQDLSGLHLDLYEVTASGVELVYASAPRPNPPMSSRRFEANLPIANRSYQLVITPFDDPAFIATGSWPLALFVAGLLFTVLLGAYANDLANRAAAIAGEVTQRTEELSISKRALETEIAQRAQTETALAQERDLLQALMDSIPDSIYFKDTASRFTRVNQAQAVVMGVARPADTYGKTDFDFIAPDLAQAAFAEEQAILQSGEPLINHVEYHPKPDGSPRWFSATKVPLTNAAGERVGLVGISRDITAHQMAQAELRAQKDLFESLVAVARATSERPTLKATLQNMLRVSQRISDAERGSLFLMDESGMVTHSILAGGTEILTRRASMVERIMDTGLAGWVWSHRQAVIVNDTLHDSRWLTLPGQLYHVRSALTVPILSGETPLGIITLIHSQPDHFSSDHLMLMQAAADQMALAVRNAQIYEAQHHAVERQTMLYETLRAMEEQHDPGQVAQAALNAMLRLARWSNISICVVDAEGQFWVTQAASSVLSEAAQIGSVERGVIGRAIRTGQTQWVPDVTQDPDYIVGHAGMQCEVAAPLRRGKQVLGALNLESERPEAFDIEDVSLAESVADAIALALENAQLFKDLDQHTRYLTALNTVTRTAAEARALDDTLPALAEQLGALLAADGAGITLWDDVRQQVIPMAASGSLKAIYPVVKIEPGAKTLTAAVLELGQVLAVDDVFDTPYISPTVVAQFPVRSLLGLPLLSGDEKLGAALIAFNQLHRFTPIEIARAEQAARQIALGLTKTRLLETTRQQLDTLHTLHTVSQDIAVSLDLQAVYEAIHRAATRLMPVEVILIALLDNMRPEIIFVYLIDRSGRQPVARIPAGQGLSGMIITSGQPRLIADLDLVTDVQVVHLGDPEHVHSVLAVPLQLGGQTFGALSVQSYQVDVYTSADQQLLMTLANQAASAIQNARLFEETRRRARQLTSINELAQELTGALELKPTCDLVTRRLTADLGYFNVAVLTLDATRTEIELQSLAGAYATLGIPSHFRLSTETGLLGQVARTGERVWVNDTRQHHDFFQLPGMDIRSQIILPLKSGGQVLGLLSVDSDQPSAFDESDLATLTTVSDQLALALEKARLYEGERQERSRLQALIRASRDGVVLVGLDLRVLVINKRALELLNLPETPEHWLQRSLLELLSPLRHHAPGVLRAMIAETRRARVGDEPPGEGEADLAPQVIHWTNLPVVLEAHPLGRLILLRDVTEERALEKMRDDLTHTMVHDLRNPLTSIGIALNLLDFELTNMFTPMQAQTFDLALQGVEQLVQLVNAILDVSRLEKGQMPLERQKVVLNTVVDEVLLLEAPLAQDRQLHLHADLPTTLPLVWVDPNVISRVFQNLVGNALKFTPAEGQVFLAATPSAESPDFVCLSVRDTGHGIPPELQGQLFQKFVTGRQLGRGSGLGLAFCRLAVEAHGGRIWVETQVGEGTTFFFTLPVVK